MVQYGETVVLVTATEGGPRNLPFFPMTVEYSEKTYATGRIPGGYFKREGRLGEKEILTCRLIDRPVRPLFEKGYNNDTQIIAMVVSMDLENEPDVLAITGASAALMISDVPWNGPIAGVRVGRVDGEFVANPTVAQREQSSMDLIMAVTTEAIVMVEGLADEADEELMLEAMDFGQAAVKDVLNLQLRLREACGKAKLAVEAPVLNPAILEAVQNHVKADIRGAMLVSEKDERSASISALRKDTVKTLLPQFEDTDNAEKTIKKSFDKTLKHTMRHMVATEEKRIDGRGPADIRQITTEVGVLPRTHGSSLFTRGETQALVTVTLGTNRDVQRIDTLAGPVTREFLLHYNFPPFCVGETRPLRGPGRREIGHGTLARRALMGMVPSSADDYPYTIRIVSEVTESNGSSSMASVCGGTMCMLDAGVPMKAPVAGIAMGLIKEGDDIVVLSDILGDEDHLGDMDFKVCGTAKGITAFQLDTKISGINRATMKKALNQARDGRLHILDNMLSVLDSHRTEMSPYAPRIITLKIKPSQIGAVIGSGGKTIRGIIDQTGVSIDVEDDGTVSIASSNEAMANKAIEIVRSLTQEPEVGKTYLGVVKRIVDFGAFIEILPGTDGLCHVSELSDGRVERVEDVLKEGEECLVKCLSIDRQGKIRLSRKEALAEKQS
jgi:polyribonucleotide nucleotidyltransferase